MNKKFFLALNLWAAMTCAGELTGREIAQKVYDREDGDSRESEMTLTLVNKNGAERVRKVKSFSIDQGKDRKSVMFFEYPGDVRNTGFLTYDYDDPSKEDDKWLYLPAMKKTRRISGSSSKTQYFMGTDFTYDDMGKKNVDESQHQLLREEKLGEFDTWVLESVPKDPDEIYSRKVMWIRKDCLIAIKGEYYDRHNELHRVFEASDLKQIDGFWTVGRMEMRNVQNGHKTIILNENQKYNTDLSADMFTVPRLERGK